MFNFYTQAPPKEVPTNQNTMQAIRYYTVLKAVIGFFLGSLSVFLILYPFEPGHTLRQVIFQWLLIVGTGLIFSVAIFLVDWFPFIKLFQVTEENSFESAEYIEADNVEPTAPAESRRYRFVGASVAGKGKRDEKGEIKIPCQDAHAYASIGEWSVLVVADGAGSYENSRMGSTYCVEQLPTLLPEKFFQVVDGECDLADSWRKSAIGCFQELVEGIKSLAKEKDIDYHTMGCTINVVAFNHTHLLTAHIGDGRAAYKKHNADWKSLLTPFKGDEPGSTVFLTSDYTWENTEECIETNAIVLNEPIEAAVLLSDGMETYSFLCYTKDEEGIYSDPNEPFAPFLDGNLSIIRQMYAAGKTDEDVSKAWENYLLSGKKLVDEYDDKTMVIAFKA